MFAFGDKDWPGLAKLNEECGEVVQIIGKLMNTRGSVEHWDGQNLKISLTGEVADVLAAIQFVSVHCNLDRDEIARRADAKLRLFEAWHLDQDRLSDPFAKVGA